MTQQRVDTGFRTFQASTTIGKNLRVKLTSGKLAVAGINDQDLGFLEDASLAADQYCNVALAGKPGTQHGVASGAITQYARVYPAASGKVTSINSGGKPRWIAMQAATTDGDIIELLPFAGEQVGGAITAASSALTASSTETTLGTVSIGANSLKAGDVLHIRAQAIVTASTSTDTFTLKLKAGGTLIATSDAPDGTNNDIIYIDFQLVIRTATTMVGAGVQANGVVGTVTAKPILLASTACDLTAAMDITATGTISTTSASDSMRLDVLSVVKIIG